MFPHRAFIRYLGTLAILFLLSGCVAAVGAVAGVTIAAVKTVVTVPIKVGSAVVGAIGDDDDEEDEDEDEEKPGTDHGF